MRGNDMPGSLYLHKRNGTYYFRRRVPQAAVAALGRDTIMVSLGAKNLSQAKSLRTRQILVSDSLISEALNRPGAVQSGVKVRRRLTLGRDDGKAASGRTSGTSGHDRF